MSKKTWILISCLVLSLTLGLGGSLAYLTDRDADVNVFTMGNVDIELVEDFTQGSELIPGVKINKDAHIENTGKNDAWVWMTVAIPENLQAAAGIENSSMNPVHVNVPGKNWLGFEDNKNYWDAGQTEATPKDKCWIVDYTEVKDGYTDANGVKYRVLTHLYNGKLAPGEKTTIALTQVYMDSHVDITPDGDLYWVEKGVTTDLNWNVRTQGNPVIYVSAYAIQTEGFETVQAAYDAYNAQWTTEGGVNNGLIWGEVVSGKESYKNYSDAPDGTKRYEAHPIVDGQAVEGLTVLDTTGEGESLRALYNDGTTSPRVSQNLVVKNSYLDGTYAMNVYAVVGSGAKLIVSDTTLAGWTSFADFASAEFTNCKFMVNSKGQYNYLRAYCPTTLTDCELAGTTLDTEGSASIALVNCTFNGEKITDLSKINIETGANVSIGTN